MIFRRLLPDDLPAYRALWAEGLMRVPHVFLFGAEDVAAIPDKDVARMLETSLTVGAFDEAAQLVGFVVAKRGGPKRLRHMADIGPLYVRAEVERQGIGRALMESVLEGLGKAGIAQAELVVDVENTGAQALYRSLGFHVFGCRPRSVMIDGHPRDDFLMIKALDGADLTRSA